MNYALIMYVLVLKLEDGLEGTQWLLKATGMLDHQQVGRFLHKNLNINDNENFSVFVSNTPK